MNTGTTISLKLYDLISAARAGKLMDIVERDAELERLARILLHPTRPHAALVAEPGSGKTSLTEALALRLHQDQYRPLAPTMYRLTTEPIKQLLAAGDPLHDCLDALQAAAGRLQSAVVVIEDIQLLAAGDPGRLELTLSVLQALASQPNVRLIVTTTSQAYHGLLHDDYVFSRTFTALELQTPTPAALIAMVDQTSPRLERLYHQTIRAQAIAKAVEYGSRFGHGRSNPDAAIRLLEETCVKLSLEGGTEVTADDIEAVVSERERLPLSGLHQKPKGLAELERKLTSRVIGQPSAMGTIAAGLARAGLGLADPTKPRGSFLLLGPSGVGKTETAKALAEYHYNNPYALIRLDMSEYAQEHAAVRVIGAPPGYVGYEAGGQLTGPVMRNPNSLILLDEIEKAHPKVFDLFLQLLDDGRLTDSAGHTVDFTSTLVLATSNTGSALIAKSAATGTDVTSPVFIHERLLPLLLETYRPEFINRFDAVLVFRPLAIAHLVALAQRELATLENRLSAHNLTFAVPDATLASLLGAEADPLFGARPVRRLIATHFEAPIAQALLHGRLRGPLTITGTEPWLTAGGAST